jgi:hypothetical protein
MEPTGPNHPSGASGAHRPRSAALTATLAELRNEVVQHLADASRDWHMPHLIHRVALQARADGLRAEQVVVALGEVCDNLPGADYARPSTRDRIRWNAVSALITAYYDGDPDAS